MTSGAAGPLVTLTFDNGPVPGVTDRVLDILAEHAVHATFFVVGDRLDDERGHVLVHRALAEGHRVGSHTATHTTLMGEAPDPVTAVAAEMVVPARRVAALGGEERLHRPYAAGGVLDHRVLNAAAVSHMVEHRRTCALWTSVPHDWDDPDGWVERALADVDAAAWSVVVLHDVDPAPVAHLPRLLGELAARRARTTTALPGACTPVCNGRVCADLTPLLPTTTAQEG